MQSVFTSAVWSMDPEVPAADSPSTPKKNSLSLSAKLSRSTGIKRKCSYCEADGMLKRKRKCKMCDRSYCSDCCSVRACYPLSYGYNTPKWACNECSAQLFSLRTSTGADSPSSSRAKSPIIIEGSYHTCEDGNVHTAFKMADPVCRLFFRFSGMYDGGKFDRSTLQKAMTLNKALVKLPSVGDVSRHFLPVPREISEDSWDLATLYMRPPFVKRKKRKKSKKSKRKKNKAKMNEKVAELKESSLNGTDSANSLTSGSDVDSDSSIAPEFGEISVFVYKPKKMEENEALPVVVRTDLWNYTALLNNHVDLVPWRRILHWKH